ncbi:hypothetical protein [Limnoglobus roseus]|uniref:DUF3352 domain-containing protein n=1 Tax=Limnoglobus roseus TaxID=2598579 RepID=A0A5C1AMR3_9BACT|nr:hypothetical protein [Limnoglobus roseus]QEL19403.1 hypothetical protein PX52LOC_06474 [Limnoglobus roseus]
MRMLVTAVVLLATALPLVAQPTATPRDELLSLVPSDTAICLIVQGVRDRSQAVAASPLAAWVSQKYGTALGAAPELQKLKDVETLFTSFLGVTPTDLRDDIFGDAIVLTYKPGPVGKPEQEQGCVMLKARDPAKLAKLVDQLNKVQNATKELTAIVPLKYRGQEYFKRAKSDDRSEFYLLDDGLFVFAAQEASIHSVIDQRLAPKNNPPPIAKSIEQLRVQDAFILCWFNPRKLDTEVKAHIAAAGSAKEKAARQQFAQIWSALDNIAIYLDAKADLEFGVAAAYRADALPGELRSFLQSRPKSSALWQVIPEDALLAIAGRATGRQIMDVLLSFTPAEDRDEVRQEIEKSLGAVIGRQKVPDVLRGIGPDWGVWVTQPGTGGWWPTVTLAVGVTDDPATVRTAVEKTVAFYSQFAQVGYNRDHDDQIESQTERPVAGPEVTIFSNPKLFSNGFLPCYALSEGHLIVSSSPKQVAAFRKPGAVKVPPDEAVVLRVSGAALQGYLGKHGKEIAEWAATQQDRPVASVNREVTTLAEILHVLDRGELVLRGDGQVLRCGVRLKFIQPLTK